MVHIFKFKDSRRKLSFYWYFLISIEDGEIKRRQYLFAAIKLFLMVFKCAIRCHITCYIWRFSLVSLICFGRPIASCGMNHTCIINGVNITHPHFFSIGLNQVRLVACSSCTMSYIVVGTKYLKNNKEKCVMCSGKNRAILHAWSKSHKPPNSPT